jgi:hypothetical protein
MWDKALDYLLKAAEKGLKPSRRRCFKTESEREMLGVCTAPAAPAAT